MATATDATALNNFWRAVLGLLGAPATRENLDFLNAWSNRENTAATNNPLGTTLQAAGSTTLSGNTAGVQNYSSAATGAAATAQTLQNIGAPIVAALRTGNPWTANDAGNLSSSLLTWSTNGYSKIDKPSAGSSGSGVIGTAADIVKNLGETAASVGTLGLANAAGLGGGYLDSIGGAVTGVFTGPEKAVAGGLSAAGSAVGGAISGAVSDVENQVVKGFLYVAFTVGALALIFIGLLRALGAPGPVAVTRGLVGARAGGGE